MRRAPETAAAKPDGKWLILATKHAIHRQGSSKQPPNANDMRPVCFCTDPFGKASHVTPRAVTHADDQRHGQARIIPDASTDPRRALFFYAESIAFWGAFSIPMGVGCQEWTERLSKIEFAQNRDR